MEPSALQEGSYLTPGNGSFSVMNGAPHPNALKVYLNWFLSQDGQTAWARAAGHASRRVDVPTDHLNPAVVPAPGGNYTEKYSESQVRLQEEVEQYMRTVIRP
jgi:ABC-type Fe3+ transport system substrate-binding protein